MAYYSFTTNAGDQALAGATMEDVQALFKQMAVGDGGGTAYDPTKDQAALRREVWRGAATVSADPEDSSRVIASVVIPASVGGFSIREAGIFNASGSMLVVAKLPLSDKVLPGSGASNDLLVKIYVKVTNASSVPILIDPTTVYAKEIEFLAHKNDSLSHITTALHTKTGTTHNLDVPAGAKNLTFLATADIADGDTWTVNGQPVTAVLQNGEPLPGELFKSGCWVTGVYWDGEKLGFKVAGGGSILDYDFPLTISLVQPSPLANDHIWIKSDAQLNVIIDDVIRASDDNCYCIISAQDHGLVEIQTNKRKKLSDGSKIEKLIERHQGDFYSSGTTTLSSARTAKSGGISVNSLVYKPRVYSKINGIVQMEDAFIWNGSTWEQISYKGKSLLAGNKMYDVVASDTYQSISLPAILLEHSCISRDKKTLCIDTKVYVRTGNAFTLKQTMSYKITSVSDDGSVITCLYIDSNKFAHALIYYLNSSGTYVLANDFISSGSFGTYDTLLNRAMCKVSPDGNYVAFLYRAYNSDSAATPQMRIYKRNSTVDYGLIADSGGVSGLKDVYNCQIAWSGNSKYVWGTTCNVSANLASVGYSIEFMVKPDGNATMLSMTETGGWGYAGMVRVPVALSEDGMSGLYLIVANNQGSSAKVYLRSATRSSASVALTRNTSDLWSNTSNSTFFMSCSYELDYVLLTAGGYANNLLIKSGSSYAVYNKTVDFQAPNNGLINF